jgi:hypothetical protein
MRCVYVVSYHPGYLQERLEVAAYLWQHNISTDLMYESFCLGTPARSPFTWSSTFRSGASNSSLGAIPAIRLTRICRPLLLIPHVSHIRARQRLTAIVNHRWSTVHSLCAPSCNRRHRKCICASSILLNFRKSCRCELTMGVRASMDTYPGQEMTFIFREQIGWLLVLVSQAYAAANSEFNQLLITLKEIHTSLQFQMSSGSSGLDLWFKLFSAQSYSKLSSVREHTTLPTPTPCKLPFFPQSPASLPSWVLIERSTQETARSSRFRARELS